MVSREGRGFGELFTSFVIVRMDVVLLSCLSHEKYIYRRSILSDTLKRTQHAGIHIQFQDCLTVDSLIFVLHADHRDPPPG